MIGDHTRSRENDDLPLWRGPAVKKKPPFFNEKLLPVQVLHESKKRQLVEQNLGHVHQHILSTVFHSSEIDTVDIHQ